MNEIEPAHCHNECGYEIASCAREVYKDPSLLRFFGHLCRKLASSPDIVTAIRVVVQLAAQIPFDRILNQPSRGG
jgi:hypothetical protein